MGRLSEADHAWLRDARDRLRTYDPDRPDALAWLLPELHVRTGCAGTAVYAVEERAGVLGLAFGRFAQEDVPGERVFAKLDGWLRSKNRGLGVYDPKRPAPSQRDRLIVMPAPSAMVAGRGLPRSTEPRAARRILDCVVEEVLRPCGWDRPHAHILVCDGPRLVAWFGQTERRGFTHRQLALLRAIAAPLKRRLLFDEDVVRSGAAARTLDAVLELLPTAAFVISKRHAILHANTAARALLERDRTIAPTVCVPARLDPHRFEVTRIPTGATSLYLVVAREPVDEMVGRVARAARRWSLTPRETEVLGQLAPRCEQPAHRRGARLRRSHRRDPRLAHPREGRRREPRGAGRSLARGPVVGRYGPTVMIAEASRAQAAQFLVFERTVNT